MHLRFQIGSRRFALPMRDVSQVALLRSVRTVPRTPDFIRGLMEYQGRLLTVVDAGRLLGHRSTGRPAEESLVILSPPFQHLALAIPGMPNVGVAPDPAPAGSGPEAKPGRAGSPDQVGILEAGKLVRTCRDRMDRFRTAGGPSSTTAGG